MRWQPEHSLRARLLWLLLAAIALTALGQAAVAYRTARAEADEIFDYHMQQMALALRSGWPAVVVDGLATGPREEEGFDFVVQVWTADGVQIFESARASIPRRTAMGFADVAARGTSYRVYTMQSGEQVVQVAQDMAARREMAGTLALRTVAPIALVAPLLMLTVWGVVSHSLAPVARVRRQLAERHADDLGGVVESGLPDEIRPLVHELNLLFERVRQAFEAQKSFVADAAHELRSPLAALRLQVQGLQRASDESARAHAVVRLTAGIDRATRLVEQLLVLARHQTGAASDLNVESIALADVARRAVADAAPAARARRVDIGVARADEGSVRGHAEALLILVRNLLDNAAKYAPEGGTVDVTVEAARLHMELTIEDSGPGIPAGDRARVFDRFYRVAGTPPAGSGLGLAIVKSIAELHGATLALDASARLGGLKVTVCFARIT